KFEAGFRAGIQVANPAAGRNVLVAYTGTFDDESKGIEVGLDLYRRGCDIVFHAAGLDGLGVIKAAEQAHKLVIGVDSDQSHVAPDNVLTSMIKHTDLAVYRSILEVLRGRFQGGDVVLGLSDKALGLARFSGFRILEEMGYDSHALVQINNDVKSLQAAVATGRITVPATPAELKAFRPPDAEARRMLEIAPARQ
ncbi:MAG TPA: BMP family ABC transporter substrate-binding protein, partial [Myxococcales bacterium]|nr:BMP family ABC transporter substrate-binding protein [Myxococcales bacterium]